MRKIFLVLLLGVLLVGVLGIVVAGYFPNENDQGIFAIDIQEGWNLIYGFMGPDQIVEGDWFVEGDIKAVYVLDPVNQDYIRMYPNRQDSKITIDDDILVQTAAWVYSEKEGTINYRLLDQYVSFEEIGLYAGWNFFSTTPDLFFDNVNSGKLRTLAYDWDSIKGDCDIQREYFWQPDEQRWIDFSFDDLLDEPNILGYGMAFEVASDCTIGGSGSSGIGVPSLPGVGGELPEGEEDYEYLIEENISPFSIRENSKYYSKENCDVANKGEDECEQYGIIYDYSGEGIDYISVMIEIPSKDFGFNDAVRNLKSELDGEVSIDDSNWNEHFYWGLNTKKQGEDTRDLFLVWESNGKLIVITLDDFDDPLVDDSIFDGLFGAYFNKYPSTSGDDNDGPM